MKLDPKLVERWAGLREHPALWTRHLSRGEVELSGVVAEALLHPHTPDQMMVALIRVGEWDAAALLIKDDLFTTKMSPADVELWERQFHSARATAVAELNTRWAALDRRAKELGLPSEPAPGWGERREDDNKALLGRERQVMSAHKARAESLRSQAETLGDTPGATARRDEIDELINAGALDLADKLLHEPVARVTSPLPYRAVWPYSSAAAPQVWLSWFFDDAPPPVGFERFMPGSSDRHAWRLLEALYRATRDEGETVLLSLGRLLGTQTDGVVRDADGWHGRLHDLSAPGFLAFGRARWPQGVRVWLPVNPETPPRALPDDGLLIRVDLHELAPGAPNQPVLRLSHILSVLGLSDEERRRRILATLGAQLPLDRLFERLVADDTTRWPSTDDLIDGMIHAEQPVLMSAPPGIGKTVLLQLLAKRLDATVLTPNDELPESGAALIDCAAGLDAAAARRLVQAIHWIRGQDPPPVVVVSARPEAARVLARVRRGFFQERRLPSLVHADARRHAQSLLAWGGVKPEQPWLVDRLATLSGGNPQALAHLCGALTRVMFDVDPHHRSFSEGELQRAWEDPHLRSALRALFWEPLADRVGLRAVAKAVVECGDDQGTLQLHELAWAAHELYDARLSQAELDDALELLSAYGFIEITGEVVSLCHVGPALLLPTWL